MTIFWDWNGTLVDDVELTLAIENEMFCAKGYRHVGMEEYREHFTFPVADYYHWLGVTEEDFNAMNLTWLEVYAQRCGACRLHPRALEAVNALQRAGHRQVIISASEQGILRGQVAAYPELDGKFDQILGLENVFARSKVQRALDFLKEDHTDPQSAVFLGDTCHDAEVARAIGCRCALIEGGHQSRRVLETAGVPVASDAMEALHTLGIL